MSIGVWVGIGIAVVLAIFFIARPATAGGRRPLQITAVLALATIAGIITHIGSERLHPSTTPRAEVDRAMGSLARVPMLNLILKEVPQADGLIREAIESEIRTPTTNGPPRTFTVIRQLMHDYIVPRLQVAEGVTMLAAAAGQAKIAEHLKATNVALCREFGLSGIQNTDRLNAEGQRLLRDALASLEAAYRSGKERQAHSVDMPSQLEIGQMLTQAGFAPDDFNKLSRFATLSESDACTLTVLLYQAPAKLPADKGASLARAILVSSYR